MPKIKIVCDRCGSEDVRRDACASWNTDTQDWELASTYDSFSCDDCDDECGVEEIEIPDEAPVNPAEVYIVLTSAISLTKVLVDATETVPPA